MRLCCSLATSCAGMLLGVGFLIVPALAQAPAADTQKAPAQTQPAVPQAYQLDIRNVLGYQFNVTTRAGMAPPTITKYREMVVFDVDGDDLVVYIGSPNLKAVAAAAAAAPASPQTPAPRPAERHAGGSAGEHGRPAVAPAAPDKKPVATEESEKATLIWTRHVLGKDFTRNADGTISFRPPQGAVMPYPVLPLPPATLKEKERFDLTVPDLALGEGKTVQVSGLAKLAQDGKLTIDGRMDSKPVPGGMPELAIVGYDIPAAAAVVSGVRMTRRLASEAPPAPAPQPAGEQAHGPHGDRGPTPKPAAPAVQPMTSVLIQLATSKAVTDDLRKALISTVNTAARGSGEADAAVTNSPSGEAAPEKPRPVTGNLWDQVDKIGAQAKEKSEGAAK